MNTVGKGSAAENRVATYLEERGWVVGGRRHRKGGGDWLALRFDHEGVWEVRLIEVKSDKDSPWEHFRPADRKELLNTAEQIQAEPLLAWTPTKNRLKLIPAKDWP